MGIFSKKNNKANFYKEYKITEKLMKESTITHITEDKIHIETGSYNNGLISVLDIDVTVNIMKAWEWRFQKYFIPIIATAFGDLFIYSPRSEKCYFFQTQYNNMEEITDNIDELLNSALIDRGIIFSVLLKDKFNNVYSKVGTIKYNEAYILNPWIMLGGNDIVENYSIGDLTTYLKLVSQTLDKE